MRLCSWRSGSAERAWPCGAVPWPSCRRACRRRGGYAPARREPAACRGVHTPVVQQVWRRHVFASRSRTFQSSAPPRPVRVDPVPSSPVCTRAASPPCRRRAGVGEGMQQRLRARPLGEHRLDWPSRRWSSSIARYSTPCLDTSCLPDGVHSGSRGRHLVLVDHVVDHAERAVARGRRRRRLDSKSAEASGARSSTLTADVIYLQAGAPQALLPRAAARLQSAPSRRHRAPTPPRTPSSLLLIMSMDALPSELVKHILSFDLARRLQSRRASTARGSSWR